jgi:hypothetical protein
MNNRELLEALGKLLNQDEHHEFDVLVAYNLLKTHLTAPLPEDNAKALEALRTIELMRDDEVVKVVKRNIETIRTALQNNQSEWRDIETAPIEGVDIEGLKKWTVSIPNDGAIHDQGWNDFADYLTDNGYRIVKEK